MLSAYAQSIGVTKHDGRTAHNIRLSMGDCKHLLRVLKDAPTFNDHAREWSRQLVDYLLTASSDAE